MAADSQTSWRRGVMWGELDVDDQVSFGKSAKSQITSQGIDWQSLFNINVLEDIMEQSDDDIRNNEVKGNQ
jgi:hypothetical protein